MIEKTCNNCWGTNSWSGCGIFDEDASSCNNWKDAFEKGRVIEIRKDDFRFWFKGSITKQYAQGTIINVEDNSITVKLFCNGETYAVDREYCKLKHGR